MANGQVVVHAETIQNKCCPTETIGQYLLFQHIHTIQRVCRHLAPLMTCTYNGGVIRKENG